MTCLSFRPNSGSHGFYRPSDIVNVPCAFGHSADTRILDAGGELARDRP
jgi:hypothetical protein